MSLKKSEQAALDKAKTLGETFTPTELGVAMGYEQAQASSRVAPALKGLLAADLIEKNSFTHNRVVYRVR